MRHVIYSKKLRKQDNVQLCETQIESYEDMMTLTCCQDHIITENIWFVWSKTSDSGDVTMRDDDNRRTREDRAKGRLSIPMRMNFRIKSKGGGGGSFPIQKIMLQILVHILK